MIDRRNKIEKKARVLVVEHEEVKLVSITALFLQAGLRVDTAKHGKDAIEAVKNTADHQPFDFILMDLDVPNINELEASRKILSMLPIALSVPIILLVKPGMTDKLQHRNNVAAIIERPLSSDKLHSAISEIDIRIAHDVKKASGGLEAALGSL